METTITKLLQITDCDPNDVCDYADTSLADKTICLLIRYMKDYKAELDAFGTDVTPRKFNIEGRLQALVDLSKDFYDLKILTDETNGLSDVSQTTTRLPQ